MYILKNHPEERERSLEIVVGKLASAVQELAAASRALEDPEEPMYSPILELVLHAGMALQEANRQLEQVRRDRKPKPPFEFTGRCTVCGQLVSDGRLIHRGCERGHKVHEQESLP